MATPSDPSQQLMMLSEAQRATAMQRWDALRPSLEGSASLAATAKQAGIPYRTAQRWVAAFRTRGLSGLARVTREDVGTRKLPAELVQMVEGLTLRRPAPSAATVHRQVVDIAARRGWPSPGYTVYSIIKGIDPALLALAHGTASPLRPWLTVIEDDYSRAICGYAVNASAPSALNTALALRQAIWRKTDPGWQVHGIPDVFYTDHGSDFTSRHLEQVAADLHMRLVFSLPGQPRGRGKIERLFGTVNTMCLATLPGYAPRGTADRAGQAALSLAQLDAELGRFFIENYNRRVHGGTGRAPQDRWEAAGFLPRIADSLEQLDLLLLTVVKTRKIRPDGIRFQGFRYVDPTLAAYVGEQAVIRYDPRDLAEIRVFVNDRYYVTRAACPELAGTVVTFKEIASARQRHHRELARTLADRRNAAEKLTALRAGTAPPAQAIEPAPATQPGKPQRLKLYAEEE